jgi:NAD(P)-dependent dehydrogenase (short-subunit alcohol dehydrogenase family)
MGDFCKDLIVAPYGMSKAAANYLAVTMHHETVHVNGVVVAYHPG